MKNMKKKREEKFIYFDKFNVKKYYNKEEFSNFSINVFNNFRIIKKFNLNI